MSERKIGVYICYCGGNISDYVDCEKVREAIRDEPGVSIAKTTMFACSDAAQEEIIDDIKSSSLDAIVVASCSPTLHLHTFRGVAERAGLNPYLYTQVNLREQCSWAHTDVPENATEKAIKLTKAGIAKARYTFPLDKLRIETIPRALVIGGGISGLRAAIALSDMNISVYIAEQKDQPGGWVSQWGEMYPQEKSGSEIISEMLQEIGKRENIVIYTGARLMEKSGSVGDFQVKLKVGDEEISLDVGAVITATGFSPYTPDDGEFCYGTDGVLTLTEFRELVDKSDGELRYNGRPVNDITYIYCVGSRQMPGENANTYCSRYCCNAATHLSSLAVRKSPDINQFHLYRDMRTYGKFELLYEESRENGSVFVKFDKDDAPVVEKNGDRFITKVKDILTFGEELEIESDIVVLVNGMEPSPNAELIDILKLPLGLDRFFMEIHPKLRPVETIIDGIFIAGAAQGPRNSAESVASAMAAAAKCAALLKKGYVELEPLIAEINAERCEWCGTCLEACPYEAIEKLESGGKEIAGIRKSLCKGCGACVPVCPKDAIDIKGYTDQQVRAIIDAMGSAV